MSSTKGFTLVEVLVAIAIFAVLTAVGWKVFDQLIKTRERNQQHALHLMQVQTAYAQMLRDLNQAVAVSGRQSGDIYPALSLQSQQLAFNRTGVIDPLKQNLDDFEYVAYRFDAQRQALIREKLPYIYRQSQQVAQADVVLAPLENLSFQALDPNPQQQWPDRAVIDAEAGEFQLSRLPKGIEVKFDFQGKSYRWVYALVSGLNLVTDTETQNNTANANNTAQNAQNSGNPNNTPQNNSNFWGEN